MDLNSSYQQLQQNQPNSRLLRFRSANNQDDNDSSLSQRHMNSQQGYSNSSTTSSMLAGSSIGLMDQSKGFNSHVLRQSSSPAAHFSNIISFRNGYDTVKGGESYDGVHDKVGELTLSMNILNNQIDFSPKSPSSYEGIGTTSHDDGRRGDGSGDDRYYGHKFVYDSHDQNLELGNQADTLSHHLSLPRKSSEMFIVENLLKFPDSVPSSIRAKRGFATHPRSVAERVRRTRISERMRKLQELVPNIDKQTSTSEMLDLAVKYIKDLQKQLKSMSAKKAKCRCRHQK